jgi:16S rRNA G527 N7-methylase RsmG
MPSARIAVIWFYGSFLSKNSFLNDLTEDIQIEDILLEDLAAETLANERAIARKDLLLARAVTLLVLAIVLELAGVS